MEDYSRDLEKELTRYSVPNPFNQARRWQLLFVSDDGKTIAVKRYKGLVVGILVLLVFALVLASVFSFLYYRTEQKNIALSEALQESSNNLKKVTEENDLLETKLWFIDDGNKKKIIETVEVEKIQKPKADKVKSAPDKVVKMRAKAEELSFSKIEGSPTTKIRFLIRNQSKLKRISGYVHVIMKPDLESQQGWLTLPPVQLKNGIPSIPSKGRYFSINNFKSMHFNYNDKNLVQVYNNVTIFIFNKFGKKVFESTYPVEIKTIKRKEKKKKAVKAVKVKKTALPTVVKGPVNDEAIKKETAGKVSPDGKLKSEIIETGRKSSGSNIIPAKTNTPATVTEP